MRKWSRQVLLCADLVTPLPRSRSLKVVDNGRSKGYGPMKRRLTRLEYCSQLPKKSKRPLPPIPTKQLNTKGWPAVPEAVENAAPHHSQPNSHKKPFWLFPPAPPPPPEGWRNMGFHFCSHNYCSNIYFLQFYKTCKYDHEGGCACSVCQSLLNRWVCSVSIWESVP